MGTKQLTENQENPIEVLHTRTKFTLPRQTAVALGYFDGVHSGHRQVIQAAADYAAKNDLALAVFTFQLPKSGKNKGKLLLTSSQKYRKLQELGVEYCFEPPFESFCHLNPEEFFTEMLLQEYGAKALFCGKDFYFGAGRSGNIEVLKTLSQQHGVYLSVEPIRQWEGDEISSTRIRKALEDGNMDEANAMLGYPYEIDYKVRKGKQLGSTLGFPTINQVFSEERQSPAFGVYITKTVLNGVEWPSATGYGPRPTVNGFDPTCETFIPGFSGDLYGQEVRVQFHKRIADIVKFDSLQELADAVQSWAKQAREYFQ